MNNTPSFLVSPPSSSGAESASKLNRRSFLKRTGGATVATMVAFNLANSKSDAAAWYYGNGSTEQNLLVSEKRVTAIELNVTVEAGSVWEAIPEAGTPLFVQMPSTVEGKNWEWGKPDDYNTVDINVVDNGAITPVSVGGGRYRVTIPAGTTIEHIYLQKK